MNRSYLLFFLDGLLTGVAFLLALMLRFEFNAIDYFLRALLPVILAGIVIRPITFAAGGIYRRVWRYATTRDFFHLALAVLVGSIIISVIAFSLYPRFVYTLPRSVLGIEFALSLILLGGLRVLLHQIERYPGDILWRRVKLDPARRVLIVGAGSAGVQMLREIQSNPQLGLKAVGFLDDDPRKIGQRMLGLPVEGPIINLPKIAAKRQAEAVIIAIPSAPQQTIQNIKSLCHEAQLPYSTMPSLSSFLKLEEEQLSTFLKVPMALPDITGEEIEAVVRVMQSRNLSIGSQTMAFEKYAAAVAHAEHAVAVINGTAALHLCIVAGGIGAGDEVITSPFSFVATANVALYEGAKPVFVDIDPVSLNIDPNRIEAAITPRTKAILPVHIFGQPADMDPILEIAERYGLIVIEDACEAIGAEYKGRRVGALGKAGAFAFYPNKQITTGEGAVLVTNDEKWADLFRSLRNQGRDVFDGWLNHSRLGYNYRISEMNAAVGVVQMRRLDTLLRKREEVAAEYKKHLENIAGVSPLTIVPTTTRMSWFVYPVRFEENIDRNVVLEKLAQRGIPARPYFTPIHLQPFYRERFGYKEGDFPISEAAGKSILALPFSAPMKAEEVQFVCENLAEVLDEIKQGVK
ncbi:MAG: putative aminotransferase, DegT family [Anaerolineae bacterium]|jgi:dTDP-4-amino-4,6-dideoxygalactose transaminase|nr:MAG: putative aminotransferase, DegT family [Anaerolineae bacterium]